jgi:flagellar protein FliO/FliZ
MDLLSAAKMAAALLATLALIGAFAFAARKLGMLDLARTGGARRVRIVESLFLDPRRRLVLVRWDESEHLLLLSQSGDRAIAAAPVAQAKSEVEAGHEAA